MLKYCPNCFSEVEEKYGYCPECGETFHQKETKYDETEEDEWTESDWGQDNWIGEEDDE